MRIKFLLLLCGVCSEILGCWEYCCPRSVGEPRQDAPFEDKGSVPGGGSENIFKELEPEVSDKCEIKHESSKHGAVFFHPTVNGKGFKSFREFLKSGKKELIVGLIKDILEFGNKEYGNNYWIGWAPKAAAEKNPSDYNWCSSQSDFGLYIQPCNKQPVDGYMKAEEYQQENYYKDLLERKKEGRFIDQTNPDFVTMVNAKEFRSWAIFWREEYTTMWSWLKDLERKGADVDEKLYEFMMYLGSRIEDFCKKYNIDEAAFWMNVNGWQSVGHAHAQIDFPEYILPSNKRDKETRFKIYASKDGDAIYDPKLSRLLLKKLGVVTR